MFDILNCEPDIMHNLRTKLAYGERVHSRYIAEQCIKKSATYEHATPYIGMYLCLSHINQETPTANIMF